MNIGFVGNGDDKFTQLGQNRAQEVIRNAFFTYDPDRVVSGHSPVGGIDIWAENLALINGIGTDIKTPEVHQWNPEGQYGYKARNLDIARASDILYVILANEYPPEYKGRKFAECYHCKSIGRNSTDHVKSGGCWTGKKALEMGKDVRWIIIEN
jgi:hypothetical protein